MANRFGERRPQMQTAAGHPAAPAHPEPEVRRWPHPVEHSERAPASGHQPARAPAVRQTDAELYYIHCALSYQNQLLADIKTLLEYLTVDGAPAGERK